MTKRWLNILLMQLNEDSNPTEYLEIYRSSWTDVQSTVYMEAAMSV